MKSADYHGILPGSRVIQVAVSQLFRITDLLTHPDNVRAQEFYGAITNIDKMRRLLNERPYFDLGNLGMLRSVITTAEKYDDFWKPAVPDLRLIRSQPLLFIPFELSLYTHIEKLRCDPESVLGSTLLNVAMKSNNSIKNIQVSGRLRLYPPGVGITRLGITLEFREAIHVGVVAQIASNVEELLFVDPEGSKVPCETLLVEIIDQVVENLFVEQTLLNSERRWSPPITTYSIRDICAMAPQDVIEKLANLINLAPGNQERMEDLRERVKNAFSGWEQDQIVTVAGQNAALFLVSQSYAGGKNRKRKKLIKWATEAHEMVIAAVYAQQAFAQEIEYVHHMRLLDDSWTLTDDELSNQIEYLYGLLSTMRQVMRAIASIRFHLEKQGTGALVTFAKNLWNYSNPVDIETFREGLTYIRDWSLEHQSHDNSKVRELGLLVDGIQKIPPPFIIRMPSPKPERVDFLQRKGNITWLHISDLHLRAGDILDQKIVINSLIDDIAEHVEQKKLQPDFALITGDIAFGGRSEESDISHFGL